MMADGIHLDLIKMMTFSLANHDLVLRCGG